MPGNMPCPSLSRAHDERLLVTMQQAATTLSISKRTLERLIAGGSFPPPLKLGRSSRIDQRDINSYLEKLRRQRGERIGTS